MKKTLSLVLALVMLLSLAIPTALADEAKPFEGLEFSLLCTNWSPYSTETHLLGEIEKATGAKINVEWALKSDFDTRVNTVLASGDIPDVIMGASYLPLLDQGAIIPLDDYLTEENAPNILKQLVPEDYAVLRNANDGMIYELPSVFDFPAINSWCIRTDVMKAAGYESLDTWEDWLGYWRYIRANDVNGNGDPNDELPFCWDYKALRAVFMPGADASHPFVVTEDGTYTVIYEHENFQSYLEWMVQLYQEGILTSETLTLTSAEFKTIASAGQGYTCKTAAEWAMQIHDALVTSYPDATFECVVPVTSPQGTQSMVRRAKVSKRGVLTVAAEDRAAEIVGLFDWLYSEEGANLINYGVEGVHHEVVDGQKKILAPYNESFVNARGAGLIFQPFPFLWYADNYMQILLNGKEYDELSVGQKIFYDGLFMNEPYFVGVVPVLATEAYAEYGTDCYNVLREAEANCVVGTITIDEFWKIYEEVKTTMGLDEIIEQGTETYARLTAQ